MTDDVITLITETVTGHDIYGNEILSGMQLLTNEDDIVLMTESDEEIGIGDATTERVVFCKIGGITRAEFYSAATADHHPELTVRLSNQADYEGEKTASYNGVRYSIIRTYTGRGLGLDEIELILERKIGNE